MATGITHCAKETAELELKTEVWNSSKGRLDLEERLRAEGAASSPCRGCWSRSWKQTGDLGEILINGVRGVTEGVFQGDH